MSKFVLYDDVIIEQHENYQKGTYRNKSYILGAQGAQLLSIPLRSGKHQQKPVRDVEIAYDVPWYRQHWHAISTAYGRSPYFEHYSDELRAILESGQKNLFDLNMLVLNWLVGVIGLSSPLLSTSYLQDPLGIDDLRDKVVRDLEGDHGDGSFNCPEYPQQFGDRMPFAPNMSVIDLLFATGPESVLFLRRSVSRIA